MQLSIEETRDLLLPHAEHAEHAPFRWKSFDTFHPREKGYSIRWVFPNVHPGAVTPGGANTLKLGKNLGSRSSLIKNQERVVILCMIRY